MNELIDAGVDEDDLWDMCKSNAVLRRVVTEFLDEIKDEDELEDDE